MENLVTKLTQQNQNLETQIKKEEEKLQNKDKSQELKFIDFYQLQIENKKYMKEVDEKNKMLTRIYGTAFLKKADLDAFLEALEEAKIPYMIAEDEITKITKNLYIVKFLYLHSSQNSLQNLKQKLCHL